MLIAEYSNNTLNVSQLQESNMEKYRIVRVTENYYELCCSYGLLLLIYFHSRNGHRSQLQIFSCLCIFLPLLYHTRISLVHLHADALPSASCNRLYDIVPACSDCCNFLLCTGYYFLTLWEVGNLS